MRWNKRIDIEEAERIAKRAVVKRAEGEVRNIVIDLSRVGIIVDRSRACIPVYKIEGFMDIVIEPKRFLAPERTERKYFCAKIHGESGRILGIITALQPVTF